MPPLDTRVPGPQGDQNSNTGANGTSDSGGGTGVSGKVFESYIVDPTQLPAYKQHLEHLLKNIEGNDEEGFVYSNIFKTKSWYIAPIDLDEVGKDALGILFMKSDTQQIARQTKKEIWIDKRIYDQMSTSDQSDLLLHELIMSIYLLKFIPLSEVCKLSSLASGDEKNPECLENRSILDRLMPPEEPHPLTKQDNENIRFVVGWIKQNAQKRTDGKNLVRVLFDKGFDKRIFNYYNYGKNFDHLAEIRVSRIEFFRAIKGAELSGNMPSVCHTTVSGAAKNCRMEIEENAVSYGSLLIPGFNFRLFLQDEAIVNFSTIAPDEIVLSEFKSTEGDTLYTYTLVDWRNKVHFGDRIYSGFLIFKKDMFESQTDLNLESVILRSGIVVSIDKKRDPICQLRRPKVTHILDDEILVSRGDTVPKLTERIFLYGPPFAACVPDQVVE